MNNGGQVVKIVYFGQMIYVQVPCPPLLRTADEMRVFPDRHRDTSSPSGLETKGMSQRMAYDVLDATTPRPNMSYAERVAGVKRVHAPGASGCATTRPMFTTLQEYKDAFADLSAKYPTVGMPYFLDHYTHEYVDALLRSTMNMADGVQRIRSHKYELDIRVA